jgi:hypothetical protein
LLADGVMLDRMPSLHLPLRRRPRSLLGPGLGAITASMMLSACGSTGDSVEGALLDDRTTPAISTPSTPESNRAAAQLDAPSREALARAPFPVLLFPARLQSQVITAEGEPWAAVTATDEGLHLSLHGTDREHPVLRDEEVATLPSPTTFVRGGPAWVTLNEQIRSVAWHEGAVAWSLEVECDRPMDDPRCTEEDFVLRLAETLERVAPASLAAGGAR